MVSFKTEWQTAEVATPLATPSGKKTSMTKTTAARIATPMRVRRSDRVAFEELFAMRGIFANGVRLVVHRIWTATTRVVAFQNMSVCQSRSLETNQTLMKSGDSGHRTPNGCPTARRCRLSSRQLRCDDKALAIRGSCRLCRINQHSAIAGTHQRRGLPRFSPSKCDAVCPLPFKATPDGRCAPTNKSVEGVSSWLQPVVSQ